MKRIVIFLVLTVSLCTFGAWGQSQSACPGFHNPTNFNSTSSAIGSWSARVGDRVQGTGGSTGSNVLSTCSRPGKTPIKGSAILSSTYYSGLCPYRCSGGCNHCNLFDAHDHRFSIYTAADAGLDLFTVNAAGQGMQRIPPGHTSSIRLGDMRATGDCQQNINTDGNNKGAEALFYTMMVTPNNALLFVDYAIVACRYNHTPTEAGEFIIRVCGKTGNQWNNFPLNDSLWFNIPAPAATDPLVEPWVAGFCGTPQYAASTCCWYCYKPWARVAINLNNYLFDSVRVEMYTSDCIYDVDPIYAYIAGDCQPMKITGSGCPQGESDAVDTLRAPEGLLSYTWYVAANGFTSENIATYDTIPFRQVSPTTTDNTYVARISDFIISQENPYLGYQVGDTVGVQTFKCVVTSAMDPAKPFESILYTTVSNIKPIIHGIFESECLDTSVVTMIAWGEVPYQGADAPQIDHSKTSWEIHEGSDIETPLIATLHGDTAVYRTNIPGDYAVLLTMYLEDSTCFTSKTYLFHVDTPPNSQIDISKRTLCVGEQATITDLTADIVARRWVFEDTTIDSRVSGMANTAAITRDFEEFENPFMLITTNNADCSDTLYDTIYFFHDPEIHFTDDTIICNGHESHVTASTAVAGCTFAWFKNKNVEGESPVCTGPVLMVRPTQPHTKYYLKIMADAGCVAWDSVNLSLLSTSIEASPKHAKHCPGDSVTLTGHGALWYEWYSNPPDPDLESQKHNQTIVVSPAEDTRYYMVGYAADSCDIAAINVLVKNVPYPKLNFDYTPKYIDTQTPVVSFTDMSENRDHSQWMFGDGGSASGETVTHHFDIYANDCNHVTLKSFNELGCAIDTSWVITIDTFGFFLPNVFTPNKTNNNVFSVMSKSKMEKFHIAIFNRRGAMVFSSEDLNFTWDGTSKGTPCPQGAYPYVITYTRQGSVQEYKIHGTVTLIR